jgi:hypothetical protein
MDRVTHLVRPHSHEWHERVDSALESSQDALRTLAADREERH